MHGSQPVREATRIHLARDVTVIILVALALMLPSFIAGPSYTDSAVYNFTWTHELARAFTRGIIYPRWLGDTFSGLGSSTFYFYPPLSYWVSGRLEQAGLGTEAAINATAFVLYTGSGLTMLLWLRYRRVKLALAGAILYVIAPYHLTDFYTRGALAELGAYVALPLVALGIEAVGKQRWAVPLLALSYGSLIMWHLPVALLVSLFLIAPMVAYRVAHEPRAIFGLAAGGVTGVALSAIYLGPALMLQPHISMWMMKTAFFLPANWSIFVHHPLIRHLLFLQFASLTVAPLVIAGGTLFGAIRARTPVDWLWPLITIVAATMALGIVPQLWRLPLLSLVQFPWRLLVIVEFAAITVLAEAPRRVTILALIATLPGFILMTLVAHRMLAFRAAEPDMVSRWQRDVPEALEYLPSDYRTGGGVVTQPRTASRLSALPLVQGGRGTVLADQSIDITVVTAGPIVVRRFYFPGFVAVRNGVAQAVTPTPRDRIITFIAKPGHYLLQRSVLPIERASAIVSLSGLIALLVLFVLRRWRPRAIH